MNSSSRHSSSTDPLGNAKVYEYDLLGRKSYEGGATYPVRYTYDVFGNLSTLSTTRDPAANISTFQPFDFSTVSWDTTTWFYDEASGAMTNKVYADGKGPTYDYTTNGRISRRTWARGVTTDYLYDGWGNLTNKVYSDGTPQVSMLYNAVGRKVAVSDVAGRTFFIYDDFGSLTNETVSGLYGTNTLARRWDEYGRTVGYDLAPTSAVDGVSYAYDSHGRLSEVSTRFDSDSPDMTFRYEYLPGSDLVAGYSSGDFARKVAFERNRDLVLAVTNSFGSIIISFFDYKNDASGRRCSVRHGGTAYGPLAGSVDSYGYNSRSEVVSSRRTLNGTSVPGFNEDFSYDDIGNRLSAIHYDADEHAIVETYSANELNQYLQRSISDSSGNSLEEYDYDDDGNMTKDGRFHYFWNGENRLVCVSNEETVVNYAYDYRGRMIAKAVLQPADATKSSRYLWDRWNIVRERIDENGRIKTTDNIWGLDINGTHQGAGGIGGLLLVRGGSESLLPSYDANGNVVEYFSTVDGDSVMHFDYSLFGKLPAEPRYASLRYVFAFSTKPSCMITGSLEYQLRKFSPCTGRWLNRDPIAESGGVNLYNFCLNRPLLLVDKIGKDIWVENTTAVNGMHQRVCVTTWVQDEKSNICCNGVGYSKSGSSCISFGVSDPNNSDIFDSFSGDGGSFDMDSSGDSSVSGDESAGNAGNSHFPEGFDGPNPAGDGVVYRDNNDPSTGVASSLSTGDDPCADMDILDYMEGLVGQKANYSILGQNCRDFSQAVFSKFNRK